MRPHSSLLPASLAIAFILLSPTALALTADLVNPQALSGEVGSTERQSEVQRNDSAVAQEWGLSSQEFQRYRTLMQGSRGVYDDHFQPCYRQMPDGHKDAADQEVAGHYCIFNDTHALGVEPGEVTEDQDTLYPANGQIRAVVYAVRAMENGQELHLGDTETLERAQGLLKRIQFETGFYSRSFEITSAHLPDDEWDELQDLVQHADTHLLMFECFTLPDSEAVGFKLHGTPWTDEHLNKLEGFGLSALQAKQHEEGFMPETIRVLGLAGQADVRILILDPNGFQLEGLPQF